MVTSEQSPQLPPCEEQNKTPVPLLQPYTAAAGQSLSDKMARNRNVIEQTDLAVS